MRNLITGPVTGTQMVNELYQKPFQIWPKLPKDQKLLWEAEEWRHDQHQPVIKDAIIHALQNYGAKSTSRK